MLVRCHLEDPGGNRIVASMRFRGDAASTSFRPGGPESEESKSRVKTSTRKPSLFCLGLLAAVTGLVFVLVSRSAAPHNRGIIGAAAIQLSSVGSQARAYFDERKVVLASKLAEAIRFKTISKEVVKVASKASDTQLQASEVSDFAELKGLNEFLRVTYPLFHTHLEHTPISEFRCAHQPTYARSRSLGAIKLFVLGCYSNIMREKYWRCRKRGAQAT